MHIKQISNYVLLLLHNNIIDKILNGESVLEDMLYNWMHGFIKITGSIFVRIYSILEMKQVQQLKSAT